MLMAENRQSLKPINNLTGKSLDNCEILFKMKLKWIKNSYKISLTYIHKKMYILIRIMKIEPNLLGNLGALCR
jgi:hypothetical protein